MSREGCRSKGELRSQSLSSYAEVAKPDMSDVTVERLHIDIKNRVIWISRQTYDKKRALCTKTILLRVPAGFKSSEVKLVFTAGRHVQYFKEGVGNFLKSIGRRLVRQVLLKERDHSAIVSFCGANKLWFAKKGLGDRFCEEWLLE